MIDPSHRDQIERHLGRELSDAETSEVESLDRLTDAHREVARRLAREQLVLCTVYLRGLTFVSVLDATKFISSLSGDDGERTDG